MAERALQLTRTIDIDQVQWSKLLEPLCGRFRLTHDEADKAIREFLHRCLQPFSNHWFRHSTLSATDHMIVSTLSDGYAADTVILCSRRSHGVGPLQVGYFQQLEFTPDFRSASQPGGRCEARAELALLGRIISITNARKLMLIRNSLSAGALILFALLGGLLLYSIAVFTVFVHSPLHVTKRATTDWSIGLALLCFLVGAAGICGRAASNLFNLAKRSMRLKLRRLK